MKPFLLLIPLSAALAADNAPMAAAINSFSTETYKHVAQGDANVILSPFNIATALSMVLAGAHGETARQIGTVLHIHENPAYARDLGSLIADLSRAGNADGNELLTANGLWVQKGFAIKPAFEKTLTDDYHAPPALVDFMKNPEAARSEINNWTEEHTKQKIKDLFPAGSLDAQTRLALTSAIYFYGKWQTPFLTSQTQPAPFTLAAGGTMQANFMNQTSRFGYAEIPKAQILEMRYSGTGIAFDVLLPKTAGGLPDLEKSLSEESLKGWLGSLASREVQVSVPKFRAESKFSLEKTLSTMGMPIAFTPRADFSGIASQPLAISEVVHKAFVDVSEQGTEAAAATGIAVRATAMLRSPEPIIFRADHPFLFLIRDTHSGTILFMGRLTMPR